MADHELLKSKSCQMIKVTDLVERKEAKGLYVIAFTTAFNTTF